MNYASVVFAGFASIAVVWYFVYARHNFTGPPVGDFIEPGVVDRSSPEEKGEISVEERL